MVSKGLTPLSPVPRFGNKESVARSDSLRVCTRVPRFAAAGGVGLLADLLEPVLGGMGAVLVQFVATLIAVLLLIAGAAWALRMFMGGRLKMPGGRAARLGVIEAVQVDARRKLILVRRDQFEHLLLIGGPTDVVVEPTIFRGVPLTARLRPDMSRHQAPQVNAQGAPAQPGAAVPEVTLNPQGRTRRAPEAEIEEPPPQHRLQSTPAAAFAPPGAPPRDRDQETREAAARDQEMREAVAREAAAEAARLMRHPAAEHVREDEAAREAAYTAPLPPEAAAPIAQPPRNPPMRHEPEVDAEHRRVAAAIEASVALDQLREARNTLRMTTESVKVAPPVAAKAAVGDDASERVGLWQSRSGPRYDILGPPRAPTASAAPSPDSDLDAWSRDRFEQDLPDNRPRETSGQNGPTPEQISSLEQEMARLLGEIAGKRTS